MDVLLREGNLDSVFLEPVPHPEQHRGANIRHSIVGIADPEADLQVDGGVAESDQEALWSGILEDPLFRLVLRDHAQERSLSRIEELIQPDPSRRACPG